MSDKSVFKWTPQGRKLQKELKKFSQMEVAVGFQSGKVSEKDGTDICEIATYNEFGTSTIPSRPFLRDSVDKNRNQINAFFAAQIKAICNGQTDTETALKKVGIFHVGNVQQIIRNGDFKPNAPSTIRRKGSSHPLIDTGTMRRSVEYVVRKRTR